MMTPCKTRYHATGMESCASKQCHGCAPPLAMNECTMSPLAASRGRAAMVPHRSVGPSASTSLARMLTSIASFCASSTSGAEPSFPAAGTSGEAPLASSFSKASCPSGALPAVIPTLRAMVPMEGVDQIRGCDSHNPLRQRRERHALRLPFFVVERVKRRWRFRILYR